MSANLKVGETQKATAQFTDANGVARPIYSAVTWAVDNTGATLGSDQADDQNAGSSTVSLTGAVAGTSHVTATAECDPTPGKNTVTLPALEVDVTNPEDTTGTITLAPVVASGKGK